MNEAMSFFTYLALVVIASAAVASCDQLGRISSHLHGIELHMDRLRR